MSVCGSRVQWTDGLPAIRTDRLVLRIADEKDIDELAAFYAANSKHLQKWMPDWLSQCGVAEYWQRRIPELVRKAEREEGYGFHIFEHEQPKSPIGLIALTSILRGDLQTANLGYGLGESWQGRGLMREAIDAVLAFGFEELDLHRIEAYIDPGNERSLSVAAKCGLEIEGLARGSMWMQGKWRDHQLLSIINPHWKGEGAQPF